MTPTIPEALEERVKKIPENSYGATTVTLVLRNKKRIREVSLAWGEQIVKIGTKEIKDEGDLDFETTDIVDIVKT